MYNTNQIINQSNMSIVNSETMWNTIQYKLTNKQTYTFIQNKYNN